MTLSHCYFSTQFNSNFFSLWLKSYRLAIRMKPWYFLFASLFQNEIGNVCRIFFSVGIKNVKQEKFNQRTKIVTRNRENLLSAKVTTMNFASLFSLLPLARIKISYK